MLVPAIGPEVAEALGDGRAVVALESTIFSNLGLPSPANREALDRCIAAIRAGGAVPAVTAVLDGAARVGLDADEHERILGPGLGGAQESRLGGAQESRLGGAQESRLGGAQESRARKVAERDLAVAVAQRWDFGATTVSASLALAAAAGVQVFATGGIGGVHRGADVTGDVSADLDALANHPAITVSAGAKAFLDLARTLEYLETRGVPVLGWRTDSFPAFYTRSSGLPAAHRVDDAATVAAVFAGRSRPGCGVLVAAPIPADAELDAAAIDTALTAALAAADEQGLSGPAVTPFVLERIGAATGGRSVPANVALAEHNAAVAAEIATALTGVNPNPPGDR